MVAKGAGPSRSAFLSAFFTLVGTHGVHVTGGLIWLVYLVAQVARQGLASRRAAAPVVLEPVLARAGYRLGRGIHAGLSDGRLPLMDGHERVFDDRTPGVEEHEPTASYLSYTVGLGLAILATIASFVVSQTNLLWPPGIPVGLIVLAFAQIGVHLVFFLHLGSGPDSTNNILALAFGVLIVFLVITGSYLDHRQSQQQHDADVGALRRESHHERCWRRGLAKVAFAQVNRLIELPPRPPVVSCSCGGDQSVPLIEKPSRGQESRTPPT